MPWTCWPSDIPLPPDTTPLSPLYKTSPFSAARRNSLPTFQRCRNPPNSFPTCCHCTVDTHRLRPQTTVARHETDGAKNGAACLPANHCQPPQKHKSERPRCFMQRMTWRSTVAAPSRKNRSPRTRDRHTVALLLRSPTPAPPLPLLLSSLLRTIDGGNGSANSSLSCSESWPLGGATKRRRGRFRHGDGCALVASAAWRESGTEGWFVIQRTAADAVALHRPPAAGGPQCWRMTAVPRPPPARAGVGPPIRARTGTGAAGKSGPSAGVIVGAAAPVRMAGRRGRRGARGGAV